MKFSRSLKHLGKFIGFSLSLLLLDGCADEVNVNKALPSLSENSLTILIPDPDTAASFGATRNDEFQASRADEALEGSINSLWLCAYPYKGNEPDASRNAVILQITTGDVLNSGNNDSAYKSYSVEGFSNGDYHIFVFANLESYIPANTLNTSITEETLTNIVLNFSSLVNDYKLKKGNLPMVCLNTEVKSGNNKTTVTNGNFNFSDTNKTIYADLTFMCSKVRYTILFDNSSEGFSTSFLSNDIDFKEEVVATNVHKQTPILPLAASENSGIENLIEDDITFKLSKVMYPDAEDANEKGYLSEDGKRNASIPDLTPRDSWNNDDRQRAWQITVYFPENIQTDVSYMTKLTFTPEVKTDGIKDSYTAILHEGDTDASSDNQGIKRGNYYDIVARITSSDLSNISTAVNVQPWTIENLVYSLHGPYELIVETTLLPVSSSRPGMLWYRSDVTPENIGFAFPYISFEGSPADGIPFFVASVYKENGRYVLNDKGDYQIEVKINPAIPSKVLNDVSNGNSYNQSDYEFFEIIAGNLQKKIEVELSDLDPIFRITPSIILIDVREYIASGLHQNSLDILIETNISNEISYTCDSDWLVNGSGALKVTAGEGISGGIGNDKFSITSGSGHLTLDISNIFDGGEPWVKEQTITLHLSADDGTFSAGDDLKIIIRPYTTDYVIHFKDASGKWTSPHIYIYQCLEIPADTEITDKDGKKIAGQTVGYVTDMGSNAGLEYAFTNNISFCGWTGYGGTVPLDQEGTYQKDGFVHMGGETNEKKFFPSESDESIYNFYTDLNSVHYSNKANWANCSECNKYRQENPEDFNYNNGVGNHLWSGVVMEKETGANEGWYKYTLSGVATPGKAMIMFNDDHKEGREYGFRYPDNEEVGVPLFDFPDNEGWFVFDGVSVRHDLNFYDDNPELTGSAPKANTYRIYWPTSYGKGCYIRLNGSALFSSWEASQKIGTTYERNSSYYYYEFKGLADLDFAFKLSDYNNGSGDGDDSANRCKLSDFICVDNDGIYHAVVEYGGDTPNGGKPEDKSHYRFYWPIYYGDQVEITNNLAKQGSLGILDVELGYFYYDMPNKIAGDIYYRLDGTSDEISLGMKMDDFQFDYTTNNYCAYILVKTDVGKSGKPDKLWNVNMTDQKIYLRGDLNNWSLTNEFYKIYEHNDNGFHVYRVDSISIEDGEGFKVSDDNYSNLNLGSNNNNIKQESYYLPTKNTNSNIFMEGNFTGSVYLIHNSNEDKYGLYLIH